MHALLSSSMMISEASPRSGKLLAENHRVRVGRERGDKMRRRLLLAVMSSYSQREGFVTPVISDVIKAADVSRATFYSHFETMDEAIHGVGQDLLEEMIHSLEAFFQRSEDPLLRLTMGLQIFLLRSVTDSLWGSFVSRTNYLSQDTFLLKTIANDLTNANKLQYVQFRDLESATSVYIGSMMEAFVVCENKRAQPRLCGRTDRDGAPRVRR